ncbi:FERM domain-containing protein 6-like isoform X1 [Branchiostoma floridae]|uniref:FERM domain-containing protein 6-like isoform X1 n=1 Tax=Branchiostoma floridae TaxID=7739 RepID=A0A9J7ML66_BRAFL|nr:FERM domain-containing protein 6-like isoform X1 [Branchiostoma floridae]
MLETRRATNCRSGSEGRAAWCTMIKDKVTMARRSLPPSHKYVDVVLLNGEHVQIAAEGKARGQDLFNKLCSLLDLKEPHFFGLAVAKDGEFQFIDPQKRLSKYGPRGWRTDSSHGLDKKGAPLLTLYFRVQFYVEHGGLIRDRVSRQHYYWQLRQNVTQSFLGPLQEEAFFVLAALALQADMGNFSTEKHKGQYFQPSKYFPQWVIAKRGEDYITRHMPSMHKEHQAMATTEAQTEYIKQAIKLEDVAMHIYRVKKKKKENPASTLLGVCQRGIQVYQISDDEQNLQFSYSWNGLGRLKFKRKRIELQPDGAPSFRKLVYYTDSYNRSKYLLELMKGTHQFHLRMKPRLDQIRKMEAQADKRKYRESYIYSTELEWENGVTVELSSFEAFAKQFTGNSLVRRKRGTSQSSKGSSNTSGICSDLKPKLSDGEASEKLSEKPDEEQKSANHKSAEQDTLDHKSSEDPTTQPEDRDRADHVVEVSAEVLQSLPQTIPQEHEPRKNVLHVRDMDHIQHYMLTPVESSILLEEAAEKPHEEPVTTRDLTPYTTILLPELDCSSEEIQTSSAHIQKNSSPASSQHMTDKKDTAETEVHSQAQMLDTDESLQETPPPFMDSPPPNPMVSMLSSDNREVITNTPPISDMQPVFFSPTHSPLPINSVSPDTQLTSPEKRHSCTMNSSFLVDIKASPVDSSDLLYQTAFTDLSELGSGDSDGGQKSWTSPYSIRV